MHRATRPGREMCPAHAVNGCRRAIRARAFRGLNSHASGLLLTFVLLFPAVSPGHAQDVPVVLRAFQASSQNPVFAGRPGQWDARIRERGWVIREGDVWKLWYTGYNPDVQPPLMRLGYATSSDGLMWTRVRDEPLISDLWVEDMMVVRNGDRWLMFAEGAGDQAQLLTSPDGVDWTRTGTLDIRLMSGDPIPPGPFGTPTVFRDESAGKDAPWHLFYERRDQGIWLARSADLKTWVNVQDTPVLVPGPDDYDRLMIAMNQVLSHNGRYYAVLHGTGTPTKPREWCTFLAISEDLIHWQKYSGNPLLPVRDNRSSGMLVPDGNGFRLYTMHDRVDVFLPKP